MSKVIRKSNFDHEDYRGDQYFVAQRLSKQQAEAVAKTLNDREPKSSDDYYEVVDDNYILPPCWEP